MLYNGAVGYQSDSATGLQLLGHRYYDPTIGRFLSSDPAQAGTNWYAYCDNNPLGRADSSGLEWWFDPNTGILYWVDPFTGKTYVKGKGYAGRPHYRKDKYDNKHDLGPVPDGNYKDGDVDHSKSHRKMGPVRMHLFPQPGNDMHGRSGFWIHGDNSDHNASSGCMILPLPVRQAINNRRDGFSGNDVHVGPTKPPSLSGLLKYLF